MRALVVAVLFAVSCSPAAPTPLAPAGSAVPVAAAIAPAAPSRVVVSGPEASPITFARMAKYPEPGWNVPRRVDHSPDGARITYLASESGDETMSLFALDPKTGKSEVLLRAKDLAPDAANAKGAAPLSREEELRPPCRCSAIAAGSPIS